MLDGGNPDLVLRTERFGKMMRDHVVRLGRAAGPDDVLRMAAQKRRELVARVGERDARARAGLVHGRRIAAGLLGHVQPGFARLAHHGRGGVVIEVNHRSNRILFAAALASFLWAAVKASRRIWAGVFQTPSVLAAAFFRRTRKASSVMR